MMQFLQSQGTAARRRVPLHLVDATDGITPETGEAAGQPQLSKNGAAFANTTATLTAIANGAYYVELTAAELDTAGFAVIRYKSANTAEAQVAIAVVPQLAEQAMASYTQPAGFLAATFPAGTVANTTNITAATGVVLSGVTHTGAVIPTVTTLTGHTPQTGDSFARIGPTGSGLTSLATPTNITAGTITTVTNLTNLPAIPNNWLTAAGIAAAALNGKGDWNIGKTGYALSVAGVQAVWDALTSALTAVGSIGKLLVDNIDAAISSRSTFAGGAVASVTADVGITQAAADKVFGGSGAALPELSQGIPASTPTPRTALMALYMALRNKLDVTATTKSVTNDAGTVIFKKALSDDGTTYSEAKAVSGP